jgi:hypothetical protein
MSALGRKGTLKVYRLQASGFARSLPNADLRLPAKSRRGGPRSVRCVKRALPGFGAGGQVTTGVAAAAVKTAMFGSVSPALLAARSIAGGAAAHDCFEALT